MQKIIILFIFFFSVWLLPACEKEPTLEISEVQTSLENDNGLPEEENGQNGSVTNASSDNDFVQFPAAIESYIATNFLGSFVVRAELEEENGVTVFEIELNDGTVLIFDEMGNFLSIGEGQEILIGDLPTIILDYLNLHFSGIAIDEAAIKVNGDYEVKLVNSIELYFDPAGSFLEAEFSGSGGSTNVSIGSLPTAITNYLNANFSGIAIEEAEQYETGSYQIELEDGTKVYFDVNGNFLLLEANNNIPIGSLPSSITNYITANYAGASIVAAELEDNGTYEVELDNGLELYFDADGNLLYIDEENEGDNGENAIPLSSVPVEITDYIAANYPSFVIVEVELQANGDYEVRLNGGVELYFNANGDFLYVENEFELEFTSLSLPDTVQLNTVDTLRGYVANRSINIFDGEINASLGIEDALPPDLLTTTQDQLGLIGPRTILPGDSILISVPIAITTDDFIPESYDIAVVWPDIPNATNVILLGNSHTAVSTYVKLP